MLGLSLAGGCAQGMGEVLDLGNLENPEMQLLPGDISDDV